MPRSSRELADRAGREGAECGYLEVTGETPGAKAGHHHSLLAETGAAEARSGGHRQRKQVGSKRRGELWSLSVGLRLTGSSEAVRMAAPGRSSVPALRPASAQEGKGREQSGWLASPSALLIPGWRAKRLTSHPTPLGAGVFLFHSWADTSLLSRSLRGTGSLPG